MPPTPAYPPMDLDEFYFDDEINRQHQKEKKRVDQLPIMMKAREIFEITCALVDVIEADADQLMLQHRMMESASNLGPKIAGAEAGELYTLRMENAVLIKMSARDLQAQSSLLMSEKLVDDSYILLLRRAIQDFRSLFIEWVNSFDKGSDIEDGWGTLFR